MTVLRRLDLTVGTKEQSGKVRILSASNPWLLSQQSREQMPSSLPLPSTSLLSCLLNLSYLSW